MLPGTETRVTGTSEPRTPMPPFIDLQELKGLPMHELQTIYLEGTHALYCVYLGTLATTAGRTEMYA